MSGVILNTAELDSYSGKRVRNRLSIQNPSNISESESENEIEMERYSLKDSKNTFLDVIMMANKNIFMLDGDQHANSQVKPPIIGSDTSHNLPHAMFGNKTIYNGPVTINSLVSGGYSESESSSSKFKRTYTKRIVLCAVFITIAVMCSFLIALKLLSVSESNKPPSSPIFDTLRVVSREEWSALAPKNIVKLEMPAYRVVIAHTVTDDCFEESSCASQMRAMQKYQMFTIGTDDIGYNFVIGGDGSVYVGRGFDVRGEHTYGFNARTIGIALIGSFNEKVPSKQQLETTQKLIEACVELRKLREDYELYGQRQLQATESPGHELFKIIMKWKNWSDKIEPGKRRIETYDFRQTVGSKTSHSKDMKLYK